MNHDELIARLDREGGIPCSEARDALRELVRERDELLARVGPDTPDNDMVICPHCTSQFVAIPVNVQSRLEAAERALKLLHAYSPSLWMEMVDGAARGEPT